MDAPLWRMWADNCLTSVVLYVHKGKGNRNKTEKRNWRFVGGNFGSLDPTRRREKKKKVPPRSVTVKEKERNEKNIYIFKKKKESKDKNKHEAIGWERVLRSQGENALNVEMVKMVRRVFK